MTDAWHSQVASFYLSWGPDFRSSGPRTQGRRKHMKWGGHVPPHLKCGGDMYPPHLKCGGTRNCDGFAIVRNGKCSLQHIWKKRLQKFQSLSYAFHKIYDTTFRPYHMLTKCLINGAVIENLLLMLWSNRYFSISPDALSKIVLKFDKNVVFSLLIIR